MADSEYPGMMSREAWKQTEVHKASTYACGKCGKRFDMPHDFYDHLDAEHPRPKKEKGE